MSKAQEPHGHRSKHARLLRTRPRKHLVSGLLQLLKQTLLHADARLLRLAQYDEQVAHFA
eukprot:scaffold49_cov409-Prasinococcus_capsulatus_cf.AAC.28